MAYNNSQPPYPRRVSVNVAAIISCREKAAEAEARGDLGDAAYLRGLAHMLARPTYAPPRRPKTAPGCVA